MIPLLFASEILETAIGLGILGESNGGVLIYRVASDIDPEDFPEGWYIDDKDTVASAAVSISSNIIWHNVSEILATILPCRPHPPQMCR